MHTNFQNAKQTKNPLHFETLKNQKKTYLIINTLTEPNKLKMKLNQTSNQSVMLFLTIIANNIQNNLYTHTKNRTNRIAPTKYIQNHFSD